MLYLNCKHGHAWAHRRYYPSCSRFSRPARHAIVCLCATPVSDLSAGQVAGSDVRTVNGTLNMLHAAGYACFWVLTQSLLPASGVCWLHEFGGKPSWSNLLCAHEPPVVAALNGIVQQGIHTRLRPEGHRV